MDVNSPETWRWIWLIAAAAFALAEVFTPVLFFMLSFAIGAAAAAVAAFAGGGAVIQWALFVGVAAVSLAALVPLGRRLEGRDEVHPVRANRWEGRTATVVTEIPTGKHETGLVRIDRETWKAVFSAIHEGDPTPDLLALKYLEALRGIADGRATKIFLPNEMSGLFGAVGGLAEMLRESSGDGEKPAVASQGAESGAG